jgi:nicotinamidase-related amidase
VDNYWSIVYQALRRHVDAHTAMILGFNQTVPVYRTEPYPDSVQYPSIVFILSEKNAQQSGMEATLSAAATPPAPASAPSLLLDTQKAAFLFIDLQPLFTNLVPDQQFQDNIVKALAWARHAVPRERIVHIRANYEHSRSKPITSVLHPGRPVPCDATAVSWASETRDEKVVVKTTIDGFQDTELESYLSALGVEYIVCMCLLTAACVHETAIGGMLRGLQAVVVEDCCIDKTPERQAAVFMLYKNYLYQTCSLEELQRHCSN